jgi:hypothetical protein
MRSKLFSKIVVKIGAVNSLYVYYISYKHIIYKLIFNFCIDRLHNSIFYFFYICNLSNSIYKQKILDFREPKRPKLNS